MCIYHHKVVSINSSISSMYKKKEEEEEGKEVKATTYNKNKYSIVLSHAVFEVDRSWWCNSKQGTYWLKYFNKTQPHKSLEKLLCKNWEEGGEKIWWYWSVAFMNRKVHDETLCLNTYTYSIQLTCIDTAVYTHAC